VQTFLLILQIVPLLIEIIKAVESLIPKPGEGLSKWEAVKAILQEAVPKIEPVLPQIEKIVSIIVGIANKTGVFQKGGAS
jgi:hypothetical protein